MFSQQFKYLRMSRGLNQVQLAEKLGVTKQSISNWENDNIAPSIEMLEKIADFFKVTTDYLLGRTRETYENSNLLDVTGVHPLHVEHLQLLIDDLRE